MQQPSAKYVITDTFTITGRGLVLMGCITTGVISPGDTIEFTAFNTVLNRKITGVEDARVMPGKPNISLLIKCEDEEEIDRLRNWKPNNEVALIFKADIPDIPPVKTAWWKKAFNCK